MNEFIDIFGTPITLSDIKSFRIVQKEYIFRPVYTMIEEPIRHGRKTQIKYLFLKMQPFAAIISDAKEFGFPGRAKAGQPRKFVCINAAGRQFKTTLDEVPVLLIKPDGQASDVYKTDRLYRQINQNYTPAVDMVSALEIEADKHYVFYGNGIQLEDVTEEYGLLIEAKTQYDQEHGVKQNPSDSQNPFVGVAKSVTKVLLKPINKLEKAIDSKGE